MRKLISVLILTLMLTGCNTKKADSSSVSQPSSEISSSSESSSTDITPTISQSFKSRNDDQLSMYDFETAYALCVQAISEYQSARENKGKMDFSKYVENESLISYLETKLASFYFFPLEYEVNQTGLFEFAVQQANATGFDGDRLYLHIVYGNFTGGSGSSSTAKFIVKNSGGRLVIAEWYDHGKDTFDTLCRGHLDIKENNIYWEEPEMVNTIQEKIKKYN